MSQVKTYQRRVDHYYGELGDLLVWELEDKDDEAFWQWIAFQEGHEALLELGCGTGRVTRVLARRGLPILAVDLSGELLRRAWRRVSGYANVHLVRADFRRLPTGVRFGLVVAAGDPFSHMLEEWRRAESFQEVADRLEVGGTLVLDALWFPPSQRARARTNGGLTKEHATSTSEGLLRIRETWALRQKTSRCDAVYEYRLGDEWVKKVGFSGHMWTYHEIRERCMAAGLEIRRCWGDYERSPWDRETSTRLIIEAVRCE